MEIPLQAQVECTDGVCGRSVYVLINPVVEKVTHLAMREGPPWGKKDVIIPLSVMGETRDDTVFLRLDKHQIESLPTFPLHRRWS